MKRNYFLPALFVAAAFTACTQEDLVVNNATNDTFEVVGGKLLGDGFTADLNSVSATRVGLDESGNAKYVEGDKAGIGWVVGNGAVNADQTSVLLPNVYNTLYANHMLLHDGKRFNSHSNVYEGWHFAYRPYQYMQKPSMLTVKVNPELAVAGTEENLKVDQYDKMPSFSNAAFVDGDKVDEETGMVEVEFPLQFIANAIRPVLNVDAKFTENEPYNGLAITGITLSAGDGNNIFADELLVQPKGLKEIEDAEGKANVISEEYFGVAENKAFKPVAYTNSVTTLIKHESYTLGAETSTARMFLAPTQTAGDLSDLSFRIDVETGYFLIDASDADATNKASIAMMQAMLKGGYTSDKGTKFDLTKLGNKIKTVPLNLTAENFHTEYVISEYTDWVKCVELANTLATESVEFVLAADADITFDSEHPMTPTVGNLTLKIADGGAPQITIDGEVTWPINITVKNNGNSDWLTVTVNPEAVLLVNSKLNGYVRIVNNGTIEAESAAYLGGGLNNNNEVVVALGAGIYADAAKLGKISYIVPENCDVDAIQALIESAHVNNLKIGTDVELNCASPLNLGGIHLEINGGTVTSEGYAVTAKSVTLAGGSITNVDVAEDMTVKEVADANSYAGELYVAGNVNVEAKAELSMNNVSIKEALTNNGEVQISADLCTTIGSIVNNGTLKATTDVYVETIKLGESSVTTIESGKTIWYSNNVPEFKQNGTTSGKIEYYDVLSKFENDLEAAKAGDVVVLMQNEEIENCSVISAGVTIKGLSKDYTLTIGGTQQMKFANDVIIENLTIEGTSTYQDAVDYTDYDKYIVFAGDAVFNNVEFKTPVAVAGNATFEGCTFTGTGSYYLWIADYGKTIDVKNCVFNSTRSITILDDFSVFNVDGTQAPVKLNISGTTFNTTQKGAVMAGQAVEVNWGDGNVVPANVEGKEVWIRYEYYKDAPNNIQNVKVSGCGINIEGA